jgi:FO synthase
MVRSPACPADELRWSIAVARLLLPPDVHLQAPPNLSDDLVPLLDAGIDDWGGVSPVTADHVNPERAWPGLERLEALTEAAGHTLAPRLTIYPEFALAPERWLDPAMGFFVLDAADAEGWPETRSGAREATWPRRSSSTPPAWPPPVRAAPFKRCWPGWRPARRSARTRS